MCTISPMCSINPMCTIQKLHCHQTQGQLDVYLLTLNLTSPIATDMLEHLTEAETKHALRFCHHDDRVRFVSTRATLKQLLGQRLGLSDIKSIVIEKDNKGKPRLPYPNAPYFNVSHSGSVAIIGISDTYEMGVDIECKQTFSEQLHTLQEYFCSKEEVSHNSDMNLDDLYTKWVIKESVVKAAGFGLVHDMSSFSIYRQQINTVSYINTVPYTNRFLIKNSLYPVRYSVQHIPKNWGHCDVFAYEHIAYIAAVTLRQPIAI